MTVEEISKGKHDQLIISVFNRTHRGRSVDDAIISDSLNVPFLDGCVRGIYGSPNKCPNPNEVYTALNHRLMNLRKAGKIGRVTREVVTVKDEDYRSAVEIAGRQITDKHRASFDDILCDPELRKEFDSIVSNWSPEHTSYEYRKSLLKLRKTRSLRPERVKRMIKSLRIIIEKRAIQDYKQDIEAISEQAGVYAFANEEGYVYIGQSKNLRRRINDYLSDKSHNPRFSQYLDEKAQSGREVSLELFHLPAGVNKASLDALEFDLIRSRNPRFNLQLR